MIKVDETDPVGELAPTFPYRDVEIKRGVDMKDFYDLEGEIGRGKFGTVFKCREKSSNLVLAAKFVGIARRQDRKNVEREVEIMRTLQHPRLIQLYDAFETDNVMCVVLELIEGGELFERVIDDDFILTEKACTIFMRQICEGVAFIHSHNIIHLDLKPENILCLTKSGNRIKIIDFGLARKYEPDKKLQVLFGTPEFVAPEVVNFDQISSATDMWSVGVICYVLLSGLSPFMGETDVETMANVTIARYDFDDDSFDEISLEAKDFISRLLQKDKEARLTAVECLSHPWLRRQLPPPPPALDSTKENLRNYVEKYVPFIQTPIIVEKEFLHNKSGIIENIIENEQKVINSQCLPAKKSEISILPALVDNLNGQNILNSDHELHKPVNQSFSIVKENPPSINYGNKTNINLGTIQENNNKNISVPTQNPATHLIFDSHSVNKELNSFSPQSIPNLPESVPMNGNKIDERINLTESVSVKGNKIDGRTNLPECIPIKGNKIDERPNLPEIIPIKGNKIDERPNLPESILIKGNKIDERLNFVQIKDSEIAPIKGNTIDEKSNNMEFMGSIRSSIGLRSLNEMAANSNATALKPNNASLNFMNKNNTMNFQQDNLVHNNETVSKLTSKITDKKASVTSQSTVSSETAQYNQKIENKLVEKLSLVEGKEKRMKHFTQSNVQMKTVEENNASSITNKISITPKIITPSYKPHISSNSSSDFSFITLKKDDTFTGKQNFMPEFMRNANLNKTVNESISPPTFHDNAHKEPLKENDPNLFKQNLRSTPPWFSELSNQNVRKNTHDRFDRRSSDFSCYLNSKEDSESVNLADEIRKLSARLLQMSNNQAINQNQSFGAYNTNSTPTRPRNDPISCFLENHGISHPRPKFKFSNLNRDVPIGSPPPPSNVAYYLNIAKTNEKKDSRSAPESPRSSPEKTSEATNKILCNEHKLNDSFHIKDKSNKITQEKVSSKSIIEKVHMKKTNQKLNPPV